MSGHVSFLKGLAAEEIVARAYIRNGFRIEETRWKTREGEIDLVAEHNGKLYFIEVKNSRSFEAAALRITPKQQNRIKNAALMYMAQKSVSMDVDCRFDAALVDGTGRVKVLPGALLSA